MFLRLLLLFTLVPLLELFLLVEIGRRIGVLATVALVIVTGILGAALARAQGLRTLERVRGEWRRGRMPTTALLDGLLILIAGAVLLTPGLVTDLFGFFLLMPWGRRAVSRAVAERFRRRMRTASRPDDGPVIVIDVDPRE